MTLKFIQRWVDRFRGLNEYAVTIPPMDGALTPNNILEEAPGVLKQQGVDNLFDLDGKIYFSAGKNIFRMDDRDGVILHSFDHVILSMLAIGNSAAVVALGNGSIVSFDPVTGTVREICHRSSFACVTDAALIDSESIVVSCGSSAVARSDWKTDLLKQGSTGAVFTINLITGKIKEVRGDLKWAGGIAVKKGGGFVLTESWAHRMVAMDHNGVTQTLLEDLPGYPSRITMAKNGGWWLVLFAPRNQLVEFVIRERKFKTQMMSQIEENFWICPTYGLTGDFREPMQGGAMKTMGIRKPWAPSLSYGLICRLDDHFRPVWSAHSRASGNRHGVTSCLDIGKEILISCASNGGEVVRIGLSDGGRSHE